jgi:hypothetical protein
MKPNNYGKGGSLKPVPPAKKGLAKLPAEVRNKMGYMKGGGKLDMMYKNGGKAPIDPDPKRKLSPMAQKLERAQATQAEKTFNRNARLSQERNLTEMRNALKAEGPKAVADFDKELKARGYKVVQRPVKKMAQGGKLKPMHPTKDNNSFISNSVDMSPSTKKQMQALRQAMMYFTGVSPKNK